MLISSWLHRSLAVALVAVVGLASADRAQAQRFGRGPTPGAGACFYEDFDFHGEYFCVRAGDVVESLPRDMNDRISSIRTFGRVEVSVFQDSQFNGRNARFEDVPDLRREGWNNRISSIRVENLRGSGRRDSPRERAAEVVRRAYLSVLNREPDAGAEGYIDGVMRKGWTEEDVARQLRQSPEYRQGRGR